MHKFTLLAFLISTCVFLQVTNACNEVPKNVCVTAAKIGIKIDKEKTCSVLETCLTKACSSNSTKVAAVMEKVGCGASGSFYSILTIVVGLCLHRLF